MANLKRNFIELVKNVEEVLKGGEVETERFWTPPFIPFSKVRQGLQLQADIQKDENADEMEIMDWMADFVVNEVYNNQFTKDDLFERLHAPDALEVLQDQLIFVTQGDQTNATKKFLESKN